MNRKIRVVLFVFVFGFCEIYSLPRKTEDEDRDVNLVNGDDFHDMNHHRVIRQYGGHYHHHHHHHGPVYYNERYGYHHHHDDRSGYHHHHDDHYHHRHHVGKRHTQAQKMNSDQHHHHHHHHDIHHHHNVHHHHIHSHHSHSHHSHDKNNQIRPTTPKYNLQFGSKPVYTTTPRYPKTTTKKSQPYPIECTTLRPIGPEQPVWNGTDSILHGIAPQRCGEDEARGDDGQCYSASDFSLRIKTIRNPLRCHHSVT